MSKKQMEGDNQRRRALARESRERGNQPSGQSATLGSSKQTGASREPSRNTGPVAADRPKPTPARLGTAPPGDPRFKYGDVTVEPGDPAAPLTDEQLSAALDTLPYWSGTRAALRRTISLPEDNLDRVLARIDRLRGETGRTPRVVRDDRENATIVLRSPSLNAATGLDVDLAHQVDAAIEEAGAGIAG
jgi:hypothetical protein